MTDTPQAQRTPHPFRPNSAVPVSCAICGEEERFHGRVYAPSVERDLDENYATQDKIADANQTQRTPLDQQIAALIQPCFNGAHSCREAWPAEPGYWCAPCRQRWLFVALTALRAERDAALATVRELEKERAEAMVVLAPNVPESGLVDACWQVKQVAISEADNSEKAEAEAEALRQQLLDWEEREAAVCPEDVGFEEVIERAEAEAEALRAALVDLSEQHEQTNARQCDCLAHERARTLLARPAPTTDGSPRP